MGDRYAWWLRRVVALTVAVALVLSVARAYSADHGYFGFQMFPESSQWQATIERELADGRRVDVRESWPGGYEWSELVSGRGLGHPFARQHADSGLRSTLHFFTESLDWVAGNTPLDTETERLIATVTTWHNGGDAATTVFVAER